MLHTSESENGIRNSSCSTNLSTGPSTSQSGGPTAIPLDLGSNGSPAKNTTAEGQQRHTLQILTESERAIQTGSKSFRMASFFLSPESRRGAYLLYHWCRYCDDAIDEAPSHAEAKEALQRLISQTHLCLNLNNTESKNEELITDKPSSGANINGQVHCGSPCLGGSSSLDGSSPLDGTLPDAFLSLRELHKRHSILPQYFFELLEGFQMDLETNPISDFNILSKYCYHVAGVVGLLMTEILGAKDERAPYHADRLGRAMQLTNIARDIQADQKIGRVYLPSDWLKEVGLNPKDLLRAENIEKTFSLVLRILKGADEWYAEGRLGLKYLPLRSALGISIASTLYQSIGWKVRRQGPRALTSRTILNPFEKTSAILRGLVVFFKGWCVPQFFS